MFNFLFNKKFIKFISFVFVLLTTISVMNQYSATKISAGANHSVAIQNGKVIAWGLNNYGQCTVPVELDDDIVIEVASGRDFTVALKDDGTVVAWGNNSQGQCNVPTGLMNVIKISAGFYHATALLNDGTVVCWGSNEDGQTNVPGSAIDVKDISCGARHTVALRNDGNVVAWGYNYYGQCNVPADLINVNKISAGSLHTAALLNDGSVVCWGRNDYNQCYVPAGLTDVISIGAGGSTSYAVKNDGTVTAWGFNGNGETNVPSGLINAVEISAGKERNSHVLVLKSDGKITSWGYNEFGQCYVPGSINVDSYKAISAGGNFSAAIREDGTVVCWGSNSTNQCEVPARLINIKAISTSCDYNNETNPRAFTVALKEDGTVVCWGDNFFGECNVPAGLTNVIAISTGRFHTVALKEDDTIVCWGWNDFGQCNVPTTLTNVKTISAGYTHTVALKEDGTIICWGQNSFGQCNVPTTLTNVKAISAGYGHTVALKEDGTVVCWGQNSFGQCNVPTTLTNVNAISAGYGHTVALKEDGTVVCWGYNDYGQCNVPTGLNNVKEISAGNAHTVSLKKDGTILGWGRNYFGESFIPNDFEDVKEISITHSNGNIASSLYPGQHLTILKIDGTVLCWGWNDYGQCNVPKGLTNVIEVSNGKTHTVALKEDGTVVCWGYNNSGQCNVPAGLFNVNMISAGDLHTAALLNDGTIVCWGSNNFGQCNVPSGLTNVITITSGCYHNVALKEDGTVIAWGNNNSGQCNVPAGLNNVKEISAGYTHSVALKEDGTVICWGDNIRRQCNVPAGLKNVKSISAGLFHTAALKEDGTVVCWGNNTFLQCDIPAGLTNIKSILCGDYQTIALREDGNIICWGGRGITVSLESVNIEMKFPEINSPYLQSIQYTGYTLDIQDNYDYGIDINYSGNFTGTNKTNFILNREIDGFTVTLNAPLTYDGLYFSHWLVDGVSQGSELSSIIVTVDDINPTRIAIAVYSETPPADTIPPTAPTNLISEVITETSIDLSWTASIDNVGVTGYEIYRDGVLIASVSGLTYTDMGLTPNTAYTYTIRAYDAAGNISLDSNVLSATTLADATAPSIPDGLTASNITETGVDLSWNASVDNISVTGYNVYRNGTLIGTTTALTYSDSGLTPATNYTYTVRAFDTAGNISADSNAVKITTVDVTPPTIPSNLTATNITETSVDLSWIASTDNVAVTGYNIYRNGVIINTTTTTNYSDTGLIASTSYTYTVQAFDAAGNISADSNAVTITTVDVTPPTAPSNLTASNITETSVDLSWAASTDNVSVTGYNILRNGVIINTSVTNSYSDSGLTPATAYTYTVQAFDAAGNISADSNAVTITTIDVTPPTAPSNLIANNITETSVDLSWTASIDNVSVTGYNIYRNGVLINITTTTNYSDTGLIASTSYTYTVRAFDAAGNISVDSNTVIITTIDVTPPKAPSNLTATNITETSVDLSWIASTDNVGISGYNIYRNGTLINITTNLTYNDTGLTPSTNYTYTVRAYDDAGNISTDSNAVTITTIDVTPPTVTSNLTATNITETSVDLSWAASTDNVGVTGYNIYRNGTLIGTTSALTYTDTGLTASNSYTYTVRAFDAAGNLSADSNAVIVDTTDTISPTAPTNLATGNITMTSIELSWTASTDNVGVVGYYVYRNGSQVATVTTTNYTDINLNSGQNFTYTVRAFDAAGNTSTDSNSITARTIRDNIRPSAPTNLTASNITVSSVELNWNASTDNSGVIAGYYIYRNGTQIATVTSGTSYVVTGLSSSRRYTFYVRAFDFGGNTSNNSNSVRITTLADTIPPTAPSNLQASNITEASVILTWDAASDNGTLRGYYIYRNGNRIASVSGTTLTYTDNSLDPETTYTYTVRAYDSARNVSPDSNAVTITTLVDNTPPTAPANLRVLSQRRNRLFLAWDPSTDSSGIERYNIYQDGVNIGSATRTSYTVRGLISGRTYNFIVNAEDSSGNISPDSNILTVIIP